jgi:hypothetical protein
MVLRCALQLSRLMPLRIEPGDRKEATETASLECQLTY